ncbi:MAG: hypothetical protein ACPLXC_01760 [Candidatus Pacearchaeota archaeon]
MEKRGKSKKAQVMGMPFQFIFALILVAVAIFVGFFVIKAFLERAEQANINLFVTELTSEVENKWRADSSQKTTDFKLSKNFEQVCFFNQSKPCISNNAPLGFCDTTGTTGYKFWRRTDKDNMFLIGKDGEMGMAERYNAYTAWQIKCGAKECINFTSNPLCLPVIEGKVMIKLTKESGQSLVLISRP